MTPDQHANMVLTFLSLGCLVLGLLAMLFRAIVRRRTQIKDTIATLVHDVKQGEGLTLIEGHKPSLLKQQLQDKGHVEQGTNETKQPLTLEYWLSIVNDNVDDAPHIFILGPSGSGKTTLATALIADRAGQVAIVTAKPKSKAGQWGGLPITCIDRSRTYTGIETILAQILAELTRRLAALDEEEDTFTELTVVVDDFTTIRRNCPTAPELFKQIGEIGRELSIRLIAISRSKQVKALGIEGEGDILENYVFLRLSRSTARHTALLEWDDEPQVIDLAGVYELAQKEIPAARAWHAEGALLATLIAAHTAPMQSAPATNGTPNGAENGTQEAEEIPHLEMNFPASERDGTLSEPVFSVEEIAKITALIVRRKGKSDVLKAMPGYSGRKYKAYSLLYERLKRAIEELPEEEEQEVSVLPIAR